METINTSLQSDKLHQEYDKKEEKIHVVRYNKRLRIVFLCLGIFLALCSLFLVVSYFVMNIFRFFTINFNIPSIIVWIESLSSLEITSFPASTVKLIMGCAFAIFYVFIAVKLIINLIKIKNSVSLLCELNNSRIDHKFYCIQTINQTLSAFLNVSTMILFCSMTSLTAFTVHSLALLILTVLIYVLCTVGVNMYTSYDINCRVFHKKVFALNLTKKLFLLILSITLIILSFGPYLNHVIIGVAAGPNNIILFVVSYILPAFKILFSWFFIQTFKNLITVSVGGLSAFTVYRRIYSAKDVNGAVRDIGKKVFSRSILWSVFLIFVQTVLLFFNSAGNFALPANFGQSFVNLITYYAPIVVTALAFRLVSKTKEEQITSLL